MTTRRKLLCLDFDGLLHSYTSGWKGPRSIPDPPVDGAMSFLVAAVDVFDVAIHSSRSRYFGGRRAIKQWLRLHLSEHFWSGKDRSTDVSSLYTTTDCQDHYELRADVIIRRISFPLWKPPAHVTMDDRAITFNGTWPSMSEIESFKPWYRKGDVA